jgi:hypothetical protein
MSRIMIVGLTAVLLGVGAVASSHCAELLIYHSWSTPSEISALKVLNEKFSAEGTSGRTSRLPTTRALM